MKLRFVFVFLVLLEFVGTSEAATLTVCDVGCDYTIDGTDDQLEINYSLSNASVGDEIVLMSNANISNQINITDSNNVPDNITLRGANSSIILNATNKSKNGIYILGNNNTAIENFTFNIGFAGSGDIGLSNGIYIYAPSNNITIENITMTKSSSTSKWHNAIKIGDVPSTVLNNIYIRNNHVLQGVILAYVDGFVIENNNITDSRGSGVDINSNSKNGTVKNNHVYKNANIDLKAYIASSWIYFLNNTVNGSQNGLGAYLGGSNNIWENNTIFGETRSCMLVEMQYSQSNNTMRNNICYNSVGGVNVTDTNPVAGAVSYTNISNNVFFNLTGDGVRHDGYNVTVNFSNNIFSNISGYGMNRTNGTLNSNYNDVYNAIIGNYFGTIQGSNNISSDPLFANTTYGFYDFHLQSAYGRWNGSVWVTTDTETSPAIDAGDPSSNFSNEPEPNGNRINMGSYGNTIEASKSASTDVPPSIPGIPINIASTYGKYWINTTWQAAEGNVTTDSYNVSVNGTWYNGTLCTCINITTISGNYTNVSVWAFNNSGTGNLSTSYINLNTTLLLYSISGFVHDNYGYVAVGVTVTSSDGSTNTTDATGYYIIPELLNGTYNLSFSKTGYAAGYLEVTISGADATNQDITLTITNVQSAYKTSTCRSTLQWGEVGFSLLIVLIILTAGGLTIAAISGNFKMDIFPIQKFVVGLVLVVIVGLIGIAIINPVITAVGCP